MKKKFEIRFSCISIILASLATSTALSPRKPNHFIGTQTVNNKESPICLTPGCIHAASTVLNYMDTTVDPCENFYDFACGGFIKKTIIPDDKANVKSFNIIGDQVMEKLRLLIEEPAKPDELKAFRAIKKHYNLCLNETAIELDNITPIKSIVNSLGGWPVLEGDDWKENGFDWKNLIYKFRQIGFSPQVLFQAYPGLDTKNTTRRIMNFDQPILGLEREYFMKGLGDEVVKAYYDLNVDIAVAFGADKKRARKEIKEALEFEIELAQISLSREDRLNMTALYNPMTFNDLQKMIPNIPIADYVNNILAIPGSEVLPEEMIDVGVPKYFSELDSLLQKTPNRVLANYIIAQGIQGQIPHLNREMRDRQLEFQKITDGTQAMKSRWMECMDESVKSLKVAAGALYVRKYFNVDAKRRAEELVVDLQQSFKHILETIDWMDEATKGRALEKLKALAVHVAYPDELLDDEKLDEYYKDLDISSDNYLNFNLHVKKFKDNRFFRGLREVVLKHDWKTHGHATRVNAYYSIAENAIALPAGILQGIFFDNDRPSYMNYGAIGYAIGHEITHGFDDSGRQYDKDGNLVDWWEKETDKAFMQKAQCIIEQYGNYTAPETDLHLNGVTTQGENIADNGGIKEAYMAYNAWIERNGEEPKLPGLDYTPKQLFWISTANVWCSKERREYLKQQILTNEHAPAQFRVIGSLSNSKDFAKDFNCPAWSKMNPEHKCQVW